MARKPILEGGKRDEILECATQLFLINGYESTSIRMILNGVGGEVGMFYHYFSSKQELFDNVFEHFIKQQGEKITNILAFDLSTETPYEKLEQIINCISHSMDEYQKLSDGTIHWSILSALHEVTVYSMLPTVKELISRLYIKFKINNFSEIDWIAPYLLKGISGLLHDKNYLMLPQQEQLHIVIELICRTLKIPVDFLKEVSHDCNSIYD